MNNTSSSANALETQTLKQDVARVVALIKPNVLYVLGYVVFLAIFFVFVPSSISTYVDGRSRLDTLRKETESLENSVKNVQDYGRYNLTVLIPFLHNLVPAQEDFFSVITAANQLANRQGVLLVSHTSPFKSKDKTNAVVTMVLQGSPDRLLDVLHDYFYASGRFMIVTKVQYQPEEAKMTIDAQFPISAMAPRLNTKVIVESTPLQKPNTQLLDSLMTEAQKGGSSITPSSLSSSFEKNATPFGSVLISPTISPVSSPSAILTP